MTLGILTKTLKIVEHKGHNILVTGYSNLSRDDLMESMKENTARFVKLAKDEGLDKEALLLTIVSGADFFAQGVVTEVRTVGKELVPYIRAIAAVGDSRAVRFALALFGVASGTRTKQCADELEAKNWLVEEGTR